MALKLKGLASGPKNELPPPPEAFAEEASEVIRAWVVDGGLHVSMMKSFDEAEVWGVLLADVARHAANIYAKEDGGSVEEVLARIAGIFRSELMDPTDDVATESIQ